MRRIVLAALVLALAQLPALADVAVTISIATQQMRVVVDGKQLHTWPVATARKGYRTPVGIFRPYWLSPRHRSSIYNNAPMPHSIFFLGGYAIHGSYDVVGRPASHGCVRLHPGNAAALFALVQRRGMQATTIRILN